MMTIELASVPLPWRRIPVLLARRPRGGLKTCTTVTLLVAGALAAQHTSAQMMRNATLTVVPGIKVGHYTLTERPTGCTVILAEAGATAGIDGRGAAPATRETDLLDPVNTVQHVHAIVFAGGSAFGLDSASGVMGEMPVDQGHSSVS